VEVKCAEGDGNGLLRGSGPLQGKTEAENFIFV
jgi:hypothetical protein